MHEMLAGKTGRAYLLTDWCIISKMGEALVGSEEHSVGASRLADS